MKIWRKPGSVLASLVVIALLAGTASAVVIHGRGKLHAIGNGVAVLEVRGVVKLRGIGLLIVEEDVDIRIQGHGQETPLGDGRVLYEGFGYAKIVSRDERTRIELAGARLRIVAKGAGWAFLKGVGRYQTDDLDGDWGSGVEIEFEEAEE